MDTLTTFDCSDTDWTNSPNSNLNYKGTHVFNDKTNKKTKNKNKMEISSKLVVFLLSETIYSFKSSSPLFLELVNYLVSDDSL